MANFTLFYHLTSINATLQIVDLTGRNVYSQNLIGFEGTVSINVSNISSGIYFWKVNTENSIILKGKISVMK